MHTLREEIRDKLPKLFSNLLVGSFFWLIYFILMLTLDSIFTENFVLFLIALLFVAGIFLIRALLNALPILDKITGIVLKRFSIKEALFRQRILKDIIYIIVILLVIAALFPLFNKLSLSPSLQQIITYSSLALILLFVYDIGRTFYQLSEKKIASMTNWISVIKEGDDG